jgi:hypothetical protein
MPDWIGDQMAGVGPEAMRVFGRNAQIAAIPRRGELGNRPILLSDSWLRGGPGSFSPITLDWLTRRSASSRASE